MAKPPARRSTSREISAFLRKSRDITEFVERQPRLLFAIDATASRQPTWDRASHLQQEMFRASGKVASLAVQLCYYRGFAEFQATRWLTDAEQCAWRTHLEVNRLLTYQLERDLQPFGLTMNDYEILVNLSESEGRRMRMSDLAAATLQSKSRLSHQITRMENADLVRRENCESDRRGLFAVLTEHGMATMQRVAPHHVASVRRHFIDLLSEEAMEELHKSLVPIAEHLRSHRGKP